MKLHVARTTAAGVTRPLTPQQARRDDIARAATGTIRTFDRFLARLGAPNHARVPDHFAINLTAGVANAAAASDGIDLGYDPRFLRQHTARSPEIIGHELVHTLFRNMGRNTFDAAEETWADVVGNAFARSIGAPEALDWVIGKGTVHAKFEARATRDMEHPAFPDVASLRRHFAQRVIPPVDTHQLGGPLAKAAQLTAAATSPETMGTIFTSALVHDYGPRAALAAPALARRDQLAVERGEAMWLPKSLSSIRASARATLDAAARLHGVSSPQFSAVADAWKAVGVHVDWTPRRTTRG